MTFITNAQKPDISVVIVLLAAGKARRMGRNGPHKLLAEFDGVPLVRRVALMASNAKADSVLVVTGHRNPDITAALEGLNLQSIDNPDYASGMASSLIAGFRSDEAQRADGVLVLNADMPGMTTADLDRLISAFRETKGEAVVRAVSNGHRGNPVILPKSLHAGVLRLEGDIGARHLIETSGVLIVDVEIGDGAQLDVDTPEAVIAAGGVLKT